jgi:hypothetical protein
MANPVSTLRAAIAADLALQFPNADVYSGPREGKAVDRDKIAVFWTGTTELLPDVVVATPTLTIRYWPSQPRISDAAPGGVRDPSDLEQAAYDLADYLQTRQTSYSSSVWFVRVVAIVPDYDPDEWVVEASVVASMMNPAVI